MIKPTCKLCKVELKTYGALLFSPPDEDGMTLKTHLCKDCYHHIMVNILGGTTE